MQVMSSAGAMRPPMNPRTDMDNKISAAIEAGSISETDAAALETALDSIDSALGSSSGASQSRLDPSEMKSRIDSLISDQVDAGTLTEEQAAELQSLFAQGPSAVGGQSTAVSPTAMTSTDDADAASVESVDGAQGMGGMRGPRGPGGSPPPRPSDDDSDTSTSDESDASSDDLLSSIAAFVENLRASLNGNTTYAAGSGSASAVSSGLIVDQLA